MRPMPLEKHAAGKTIDPTDRLQEGFEPAALPPIAPDGGLDLFGSVHLPVFQPNTRLCERGPCIHYHRLVTSMDAAEPKGGGGDIFRQTHHTCYPTLGMEIDLGDVDVYECSLWEPGDDAAAIVEERRRRFEEREAAKNAPPVAPKRRKSPGRGRRRGKKA